MNLKLFSLQILAAATLLSFSVNSQTPTLQWAHTLGGPDIDYRVNVSMDGAGNVYTASYFSGTLDIDPGTNVLNLVSTGGWDIYLLKKDPAGNLIWAKQIGGAGQDLPTGLEINDLGEIYLSGRFSETVDVDPGNGIFNLSSLNGSKAFILKLTANGDFLWAEAIEPASSSYAGPGLKLDASSNIYLYGGLPASPIYISKYDSSGNFLWTKGIGNSNDDQLNSIVIDAAQNVYGTGYFNSSTDFDPGSGVLILTPDSARNAFLWKLDASGDLVWAKKMHKLGEYHYQMLAIDTPGNIYMAGQFRGTVDFDPGAGVVTATSASVESDGYVEKLTSDGDFVWVKQIGGAGVDGLSNITIDALGEIYFIGMFQDTMDADPGSGTVNLISEGLLDAFIGRMTNAGDLVWASSIAAGTGQSEGHDILVDLNGDVICSGNFTTTADFDPGTGVVSHTSAGLYDTYVAKFGPPTLKVATLKQNPEIALYPNPGNKEIVIQYNKGTGKEKVFVYNQLGSIVYNGIMDANTKTINTASWANGNYMVRIAGDNVDISTKLQIVN